jgi:hypothetical protein
MSESSTDATQQIPNWHIRADYVESCNCDFGCPCNFSVFPTYGFCRALVIYNIREGDYGDNIDLNGLEVIYAVSWPKAIHEGNGTMQLFITKNSHENQRQAIVNIFTGTAKGEGPFTIFANTLKYILDPQYVDINARIDGRKSSFSVPGIRGTG